MDMIHFHKMHGAGNDFILIDNTVGIFKGEEVNLFVNLCRRYTGIGADGLMLLESNETVDFTLKYFNSNGLPAEMCGNGARCAVYFANQLGLAPSRCSFQIGSEIYKAEILPEKSVRLQMQTPKILLTSDKIKSILSDGLGQAMSVNTGVPHLVVESKQPLDDLDIIGLGKKYRYHEKFRPAGTNVNFIFPEKPNHLLARVYERGVEAETLACGSGAVACAVFANQVYGWSSPISVHFPGGTLEIEFATHYREIFLVGPIERSFEGDFERMSFE
jgi:diaminopimelate epimerase